MPATASFTAARTLRSRCLDKAPKFRSLEAAPSKYSPIPSKSMYTSARYLLGFAHCPISSKSLASLVGMSMRLGAAFRFVQDKQ